LGGRRCEPKWRGERRKRWPHLCGPSSMLHAEREEAKVMGLYLCLKMGLHWGKAPKGRSASSSVLSPTKSFK